ncbi:hypothetical protein LEMLEM_LOCUS6712 [Lemmus lemmus]
MTFSVFLFFLNTYIHTRTHTHTPHTHHTHTPLLSIGSVSLEDPKTKPTCNYSHFLFPPAITLEASVESNLFKLDP